MKFGTATPYGIDVYRTQTAASLPLSLNRKRCKCGKVATAKQLIQYGMCPGCVRTAAMGAQESA